MAQPIFTINRSVSRLDVMAGCYLGRNVCMLTTAADSIGSKDLTDAPGHKSELSGTGKRRRASELKSRSQPLCLANK